MPQHMHEIHGCRIARWTIALALVAGGCASSSYKYGRFHPDSPGGVKLQPIEITYGKPRKHLDRIGYVLGTPARLITLNKKMNNHDISPETIQKLKAYMAENDITDVRVAVNEYDPKEQWKRLRENKRVAPGWRYSMGAFNWLTYTILPNRLFGGDRYSPYSNTLNLSSDVPAEVLSAAAYAKDIHSQRLPGTYAAFVNDMPVLSVVREAKAARDVLSYARAKGDWKAEQQAYHVLYPQIGGATAGTAGPLMPTVGPLLHLGGVAAGHAVGRTVAYFQRPKDLKPDKDTPPEIKLLPGEEIVTENSGAAPPRSAGQNQNYGPAPPRSAMQNQNYGPAPLRSAVQNQNYGPAPLRSAVQNQNYGPAPLRPVQNRNYGPAPPRSAVQNQNYGPAPPASATQGQTLPYR